MAIALASSTSSRDSRLRTPRRKPAVLSGPGTTALVVAFLLAVVASSVVLFAPLVTTETNGSSETSGLLESDPAAALGVTAVALMLTGLPLLLNGTHHTRRIRILSAVLLLVGAMAAILSVGSLFLPSAMAMSIAAFRSPRSRGNPQLEGALPDPG
jgi:hypothetical protein